jgi:alkyl hydroperoxide reductase subunit AhpF
VIRSQAVLLAIGIGWAVGAASWRLSSPTGRAARAGASFCWGCASAAWPGCAIDLVGHGQGGVVVADLDLADVVGWAGEEVLNGASKFSLDREFRSR